jgi:phosphoribosylanthranilate isomerase
MLHPNHFETNEAWIAFKLNDDPLVVEEDGSAHNAIALMDAASCFILGSVFFPASEAEISGTKARLLLEEGEAHKQQLPKTLFISRSLSADLLSAKAEALGISVVRLHEDQLLAFVGQAREGFRQHFGGGGTQ